MVIDKGKVIEAQTLIDEVLLPRARERFRLTGMDEAGEHGVPHWSRVWQNFLYLASKHRDADLLAGAIFSIMHDCERHDEGADPEHGVRGAQGVLDWFVEADPRVAGWSTVVLAAIAVNGHCNGHAAPQVDGDQATFACCWDADRLDLPRFGIWLDPKLMSTPVGRSIAVNGGVRGFTVERDALMETLGVTFGD